MLMYAELPSAFEVTEGSWDLPGSDGLWTCFLFRFVFLLGFVCFIFILFFHF